MSIPPGTRSDFSHRSAEELERDIAETRARLSRNVDGLSYKLSPAGIGEEVKGMLGTTEELTIGAITGFSDKLAGRTEGWGPQAGAFVRRYPVTTTLVGLGLAWLVMRSSGRR